MLESTLVVLMGEFGRTPKINDDAGRDHWSKAFSIALAGGGVVGGRVLGSTDATGSEVKDDPVQVEDLIATIYERVGIDPNHEFHTEIGRPVKLANWGMVIMKLFLRRRQPQTALRNAKVRCQDLTRMALREASSS